MRRAAALTCALLFAATALQGQAPAPGGLAVYGCVVADDTGQPLRNARIAWESAAGVDPVIADAEGRFAIAIPSRSHRLTISKTGYATATSETAPVDGVEIRLPRGGVITGRVTDERGTPLPMASVAADLFVREAGHVALRRAAAVEADDRGEYRVYGLAAADYAVSIGGSRGSGGAVGQPTYYPGVSFPLQAQPIHVAAGDEVGGVDLILKFIQPPVRNASGLIVSNVDAGANVAPPASEAGPPGTVRGRVIGPDGLPMPHARVQLESSDRLFSPASAQADEDGWYAFHDVPPGRYLLGSDMPGYRRSVPGQRTPWERGDLVTMGADRAEVRVNLALRRGSAIEGRVIDEYGDPVENVAVSASVIRIVAGRPQLVSAPRTAIRAGTRTDDRGRYRIFALAPGEYIVSATVGQQDVDRPTIDLPGYTRSYYPATLTPTEAARVEVRDGEDRLNVDITLVKGGTSRVAGRVMGADGEHAFATVSLAPSYRSGSVAVGVRSMKADGVFAFTDVPPGEYVLQAAKSRVNPSTEGEFTARFVTVSRADVSDVVLAMSAGSTISGRIVFEDADAPSTTDAFELAPVASDPDSVSLGSDPVARADVREDWTFEMRGIAGPRRLQVVHAPDGWMVKSILASGLDVTDRPLAFGTPDQSLTDVIVLMTSRVTDLSGAVTDDSGAAYDDSAIVTFACDRELRYAGSRFVSWVDASRDATFAMRGLAPTDYYVAAVDKRRYADVRGEVENPEFLESLVAGATRVTLGEGQRVSLTLKMLR
ncbi:MAG TPA: carboxypeptidase-like regulatory domain-containing protein [Vicinamibacterales bacterium]|nr:carboxypeptidase-like regulatory domain-containing protein [Vicinamibacterales bacterium]